MAEGFGAGSGKMGFSKQYIPLVPKFNANCGPFLFGGSRGNRRRMGFGGADETKRQARKKNGEDSVLDLAVLASGRPSVDSHCKGWAPGLRSH